MLVALKLLVHHFHSIFHIVVIIGLENSSYNTSESEENVLVCAQVMAGPPLARVFTVELTTQDGTAQSDRKSQFCAFVYVTGSEKRDRLLCAGIETSEKRKHRLHLVSKLCNPG